MPDSEGVPHAAARWGLAPLLAGVLIGLAAWLSGLAGAGAAAPRKGRTVPVTVLASPRLGTNEFWKVDIARMVMDVNAHLREAIGVRLRIQAFDIFDPGGDAAGGAGTGRVGAPSLRAWLPVMLDHASRRPDAQGMIVIGLVPEGRDGPVNPGLADYLNGFIVMKYLEAKGGMTFVLLHEVCHLFGAIDLKETGSVMSQRRPSFRVDAFTCSIMRVNRDRSFHRGDCPLPWEKMEEAVSLYKRRDALGLGEGQLRICLERLRTLIASQKGPGTGR